MQLISFVPQLCTINTRGLVWSSIILRDRAKLFKVRGLQA